MKRSKSELYETMRKAIAYLRAHAEAKPDQVAKALGMSPSRFNHAFREWVGIPPKRFLAYLTKERAKALLKDSAGTLRASYAAGLSGPGRLHELMVTHEAVSPGEYKDGNIEITYGMEKSPFGWCVVGLTKRGICTLSFLDTNDDRAAVRKIRESWPNARLTRNDARIRPYVKSMFGGKKPQKPIPLFLHGTNFQMKVWEALLRIPPGKALRYADLAKAIGSPNAVRAVGSACGKNSIGFLIPCHRVLASDGGIGGYNTGTERKEAMLAWEAARS